MDEYGLLRFQAVFEVFCHTLSNSSVVQVWFSMDEILPFIIMVPCNSGSIIQSY